MDPTTRNSELVEGLTRMHSELETRFPDTYTTHCPLCGMELLDDYYSEDCGCHDDILYGRD